MSQNTAGAAVQTVTVKTIDVNCKEWFDKVNGNSYFAGTVTVNFGMEDEQTVNLPFQYGYGDHYKDMAFKALIEKGIVQAERNKNGYERMWNYADRNKVIVRAHIQTGCKKRELMSF